MSDQKVRTSLRSPAVASLLAAAVFFSFAAVATSERSRAYLFLVAGLAAVLVAATIFGFVFVLLPRLGRFYSVCAVSLLWFTLATAAAWLTPSCPSDLSGRCTAEGAVASGYPFLLIPPAVWFVWWLTKVLLRVVVLVATFPSRRRAARLASTSRKTKNPPKNSTKNSNKNSTNGSSKGKHSTNSRRPR